jgi:HEAT repeat protein
MLRPLSSLIAGYEAILDASAALLGARELEARSRRVRFLVVCCCLFLAAALVPAPLALPILVVSLWLLVATCLAWGVNEKLRGRIAKKIEDTRPDSLPDLRDLALLTGLAVPCFLPLLLEKAQRCFSLFHLEGQPGPFAWLWFLLDKTYLRALPDAVDLGLLRLEGLHGEGIDYLPGWLGYPGRGLVLIAYTLVYLVLLQALGRLWQIHRDLAEGIAGVIRDPDMAVRLGRRAVKPLLATWQQNHLTATARANILTALGRIGDPAALTVLGETALRYAEPEVRQAALLALADLEAQGTTGILARVLHDSAESVATRATAADALGRLSSPDAAEPLLGKLEEVHQLDRRYREGANVRKEVVRAVGQHLGRRRSKGEEVAGLIDRAVRHLLADEQNTSLLEDVYLRVRNKVAGALAELGDARAILPLVDRVCDPHYQNPKLVQDTVLALGQLCHSLRQEGKALSTEVRERVLAVLSHQFRSSPNDSVRQAAARALGHCAAVEFQKELLEGFKAALKSGQEELAQALEEGLCAIDPELANALSDLERRTSWLWSQRRQQVLLDAERNLEERLQAVSELGEFGDARGLKALRMTATHSEIPEKLRVACVEAISKIHASES